MAGHPDFNQSLSPYHKYSSHIIRRKERGILSEVTTISSAEANAGAKQILKDKVTTPFERWIAAVFNHVVGKPEWYWDEGFDAQWKSL